jgi:hypothetical protein
LNFLKNIKNSEKIMKQSTPLKKANQMLREGKYEDALSQYELALSLYPSLHKAITPMLALAKRRILNSDNKIIHKAKLDCPPQLDRYFFEIIEDSGLFDPVCLSMVKNMTFNPIRWVII